MADIYYKYIFIYIYLLTLVFNSHSCKLVNIHSLWLILIHIYSYTHMIIHLLYFCLHVHSHHTFPDVPGERWDSPTIGETPGTRGGQRLSSTPVKLSGWLDGPRMLKASNSRSWVQKPRIWSSLKAHEGGSGESESNYIFVI